MATHLVSMLGNILPDATGRCWIEPFDIGATNDVWKLAVIRFQNPTSGQSHGFYGGFSIPQNYVSTPAVIPVWSTTALTGNHRWFFTYRAVGGDNAESLDQTGNQESLGFTDVAPGAAWRRLFPSPAINLTAANLLAQDFMTFLFERRDDTGADTVAADSWLFDLLFSYSDT